MLFCLSEGCEIEMPVGEKIMKPSIDFLYILFTLRMKMKVALLCKCQENGN